MSGAIFLYLAFMLIGQEFTEKYTGNKAKFWSWHEQLGEHMRRKK
jgi:hypothetical protein